MFSIASSSSYSPEGVPRAQKMNCAALGAMSAASTAAAWMARMPAAQAHILMSGKGSIKAGIMIAGEWPGRLTHAAYNGCRCSDRLHKAGDGQHNNGGDRL